MNSVDVLNKWIEVTNYDRDQKSFNLLSSNYAFNRAGKIIESLLVWDNTGVVPLLYAKASFESICKSISLNLIKYLKEPDCIADYVSMWQMFESPELLRTEDMLIENIVKITNISPAIGELDKNHEIDLFRDAVEYLGEELTKCNIEAFSIDNNSIMSDKLHFYTDVNVFHTTTECILKIENSKDGVYLCYINEFNSTNGYFAYIVKSGKNIISINDRVRENFIGMHTQSRNNRHIENKKWNLFPYNDMIKCGDNRDYKGYTKSLICEVKPHPIVELSSKSIYPIMLAAYLIQLRFCGKPINTLNIEQVYIDSLLKNSINSEQVAALIPVPQQNSLVCTTNLSLKFNFTSENVTDNSLHSKYHFNDNDKPYYETGHYNDVNKLLIETYGQGFKLDNSSIMIRKWPALTEGETGSSDNIVAEFIGTAGTMELEYYRHCRKQLVEHIENNMVKAYDEAGGFKGVKQWYFDAVNENIDNIRQMAVDWFIQFNLGEKKNYEHGACWLPTGCDMNVTVNVGSDAHWFAGLDRDFKLNKPLTTYKGYAHGSVETYYCPVNGTTANVWFLFQPNTVENIQILANKDAPKILTGFSYTQSNFTRGNNLISNCDPVQFIENPFSYNVPRHYNDKFKDRRDYRFMLAVGFSKRGLNQLIKKRLVELGLPKDTKVSYDNINTKDY